MKLTGEHGMTTNKNSRRLHNINVLRNNKLEQSYIILCATVEVTSIPTKYDSVSVWITPDHNAYKAIHLNIQGNPKIKIEINIDETTNQG